jgi:diacylglycerol kinase
MLDPEPISERPWPRKFRDAFRGMKAGVRGQSSFFVHFFMSAAVIAAAIVLRVDLYEWCILLTCITIVLTAEMFDSALESMAKAITGETDPHLGNSLDIGSGAVLVASIGATIIGSIIFINRLGMMLQWW